MAFKIFFQAWAVLSSNTKRDFVFSQCITMFKPTSLLGNENARLGCVQTDSRGQLELQKEYALFFTHYFEASVGRGCLLNYSISLVYMPPPHPVPRDVTHYIGRQS